MRKILFICLALSACGGEKIEPQTGSLAWLNAQDLETRADYYSQFCSGQGFIPASEEFYNCVQNASSDLKLYQIREDFAERAMR